MGFKEDLLQYYSWSEEDYAALTAKPSFSRLPLLDGYPEAQKAKERVLQAVQKQEKTLIYGDYDCDGIMATSILVRTLDLLGLRASSFIPSRYLDGYGLTLENARKIAKAGYSFVILVDNGVSCQAEVEELNAHGVDVLILDHHELPKELPPSVALLHPQTLPYPSPEISAGELSFLFSTLLLGEPDPYLLTLGGLTVLSDVMKMEGHNRELVRLSLLQFKKNRFPTIAYLTDKLRVSERVLMMEVVPAINSLGRLKESHEGNKAVEYFSLRMPEEKQRDFAAYLLASNEERKAFTRSAVASLSLNQEEPAICLCLNEKEGLNGLLASQLLNKEWKAVAVFSPKMGQEGVLVGSLRSKPGFDVMETLSSMQDFLLAAGGHPQAAGCSLREEDFPRFKEKFLEYASSHPFLEKERSIPFPLQEATMENFWLLQTFGPFGEGHKDPFLKLEHLPVSSFAFSPKSGLLNARLPNGTRLFSFSLQASDFLYQREATLYAKMRLHEFRGRISLELECSSFPRD